MIDHQDLFQLVENNESHFWVGEFPPFSMNCCNILCCTNFRLSAKHHRNYDVVWVYETSITHIHSDSWRILLDECIRLLKKNGKMVLRFQQNDIVTIINVKNYIFRRALTNSKLLFEHYENGFFTICIEIDRIHFDDYADERWSIILLSQGNRMENTMRFLESVRKDDPEFAHQIIIVGPKKIEHAPYKVQYLNKKYDETKAEISKKKNDAIKLARNANLMICHDRFELDDDFFINFKKYGYDYDFLAVRQFYEDGNEYPFYAALSASGLIWSVPIHSEDYSKCSPNQYINGGMIVGKRSLLQFIGFNPALYWNQGEDVEIAEELYKHHIIPRVNFISSCTTVGIPSTYTSTFIRHRTLWEDTPICADTSSLVGHGPSDVSPAMDQPNHHPIEETRVDEPVSVFNEITHSEPSAPVAGHNETENITAAESVDRQAEEVTLPIAIAPTKLTAWRVIYKTLPPAARHVITAYVQYKRARN